MVNGAPELTFKVCPPAICIEALLGLASERILFLSDHPDELDAAVAAGWSVLGVDRPGEANSARPPHRWIHSFDEVDLHGQ